MDAQQLIDRLEEHAAEVPVGPPPLALMRTRARRQRQGRMAVVAAAAAVAAIGVGVAWPGGWGSGSDAQTSVASDGPADPDSPPDGYRYVGAGDVVAAVPESWGTNRTDCGTPVEDTVVIDQGVTCMALVPRPADVDSLTVLTGSAAGDTQDWEHVDVAGEPALRSQITDEDGRVIQSVLVSGRNVMFVAESSSADGADVVDGILDSLTVLREHTTVPAFQDLAFRRGGDPMVEEYAARLADLGLRTQVSERNGKGFDAGTVLDVTPGVGSVVSPGDTVRVVVAR
ncbi:PASTA domain-containing protein [Nocardioides sp. T2.26MG-1]|uniref:PASTA domain-containing protein n=1 Tax=Nocardioides sp. T2.26MG-1 TaxID=3041166 RepID=UPI0024774045|nr:PASTA domain-containing protein [Nocardioides sp. T2.26MG-1]CAI9412184.1 hypothetical protein HIDPHFAB_01707 [Nocardioides sp. T2.26MG-1]